MKKLTDIVKTLTNENRFYRNPMFWIGMSAIIPAYLVYLLATGAPPRKDHHNFLTLPQKAAEMWYDPGIFDDKKTVEDHMELLKKPLASGNIDSFKDTLWKYVQFWYSRKEGADETGSGMESYSDIVQGIPGSCTEGSVAFWANMKKVRENPVTQDKYRHFLLLVTYERTDKAAIPGHCLYLGERTDKEGSKSFFVGGINSFEDPSVEYPTIERAIEDNTNLFRYYSWRALTQRGIMVRPRKFCVVDPRDIGVDLVYGKDRLNKPVKGKDARETYSEFRQRKIMDFFEKHSQEYHEPR